MNSILFTCIYWMNIMLNDSCARGTMLNRGQKGQVLFLLACLMAAVKIKTGARTKGTPKVTGWLRKTMNGLQRFTH